MANADYVPPVTQLVQEISELRSELSKAQTTLRDQFAMAALQGMVPQGEAANATSTVWNFSIAAELAYEYADAMLAAREGRKYEATGAA